MIAILIFPDFQLLDASGPASVFEIARRFVATAPEVRMVASRPGPVRSSAGVEVMAADLGSQDACTTLVVAGGLGVEEAAACAETLAFVRRVSERGVRIASVCSGAYVLAAAGLLEGRRATTHELGAKLDDLSVEELGERIALLRQEIDRLEAAKAAKRAARDEAGSIFKL